MLIKLSNHFDFDIEFVDIFLRQQLKIKHHSYLFPNLIITNERKITIWKNIFSYQRNIFRENQD